MNRVLPICAALAVLPGTASPQAPDPLDALTPTQHVLFENEYVRAIDDQIAPGAAEPMHRHQHGITVYLIDQRTDDTTPDGKLVPQTRHAGTASWSDGITHSVKNVDNHTTHAIRIDIKRADPPPPPAPDLMDSVRAAGLTQTVIFENAYVRIINDVIPVNAVEPMHRHPHGIVIYLTPNYVTQQIMPDGSTRTNNRKQFDVAWAEPLTHSVKNIGDITSHAIRIELKY
jgi:hypothetical protein